MDSQALRRIAQILVVTIAAKLGNISGKDRSCSQRFPVQILLRSRRTVDPDFETELKTDLRLLPRENPCAEQDG
jgi:hypothetical protein